ncbi:MAG: glycosyltransferase [Chloroflexi bacterium]|nr:glycosyltransferase [Chloroflexota bacterium]
MTAGAQALSDRSSVLALIPAYNEAERIVAVIEATRAYLPVLVVDDGSSDDTAQVAEVAGATVVRQIPNQGKGAALRAGFRWALERGYDAVVMLDADGQHDPAEIPLFLESYRERGSDLVIGQRDFSQMPFPRNFSNRLGTWLFSWALGQHAPDNQSGYRLLSRRLIEATLESREQGFEFEVEMIVTCVLEGFRLDWVPIKTIYAGETSHIRPLPHIRHFMRIIGTTRQRVRAAQRDGAGRRWPLWALPALLAPVVALIAVAVIAATRDNETVPPDVPAMQFPSPPPVTYIPPTPLPTATAPPSLVGAPAPDLTLTLLDGEQVRLDTPGSVVTFLNFWATWCVPCEAEMPLLQETHDAYRDEGVQVIAVTDPNAGQTENDVRAFLSERDLTLPVALETDQALFSAFAVAGIPVTYILDANGIVRAQHVGELHDHDIEHYLEDLLP